MTNNFVADIPRNFATGDLFLQKPLAQSFVPTFRDLLFLFVGAALFRIILSMVIAHRLHAPLWFVCYLGDGGSYLRYATFIVGRPSDVSNFDLRLFPGFPLLIAGLMKLHVNMEYAGLSLSWLSGGVAAMAAALLYHDRRVGIAVALLLPEYVLCTSHPQSEGPMLALGLAGLVLAMRNWPLLGGIALGCAGVMRPVICFAVLGFAIAAIYKKDWRSALIVCVSSLAIVCFAFPIMHHLFGDPLMSVHIYANDPRAYGGHLLMWPGESLVMTPIWRAPVSELKFAYVWLHVLLVVAGCIFILRKCRRQPSSLNILSAVWLLSNSFFGLLVGGPWGFEMYPRLQAPSEPALFYAYQRWLPRRWIWWILIGAASFGQAVINSAHNPNLGITNVF